MDLIGKNLWFVKTEVCSTKSQSETLEGLHKLHWQDEVDGSGMSMIFLFSLLTVKEFL